MKCTTKKKSKEQGQRKDALHTVSWGVSHLSVSPKTMQAP